MKKGLLYLLVFSMLLSSVSCSDTETIAEETNNITNKADDTITQVETEDYYYNHIEERNLEGKDFRIISRMTRENHDVQSSTDYGNDEIDAETILGTPINDAVYNRNRELEQRYNFKFVSHQFDLNPMNTARNSILANSDDYDAIVDSIGSMTDYSMFRNYNNLEYIDLSASCWDQNVNDSLSIADQHYVAIGDLLTLDKKGTWCTLFNKGIAADNQLGNLYDMVREGAWTLDNFYEMFKTVSRDLNGDGEMTEVDNWGFLTENYNMNIMMFGGENRFSQKDENDYPVLDMFTDRSVAVFEKVYDIMIDSKSTMCLEKVGAPALLKAFAEDRGLFYMVGIGTAMEYRYMESDFGILPIPKYDETQETYYTSLSKYNSACVAIPKSCIMADDSAFLLQAICLASTETLRPTFYDQVLNGVTVRDEESREMLDILFNNRVFDLAFIHNWGTVGDLYVKLYNAGQSAFASAYKRIEKTAQKAIAEAIEEYSYLE